MVIQKLFNIFFRIRIKNIQLNIMRSKNLKDFQIIIVILIIQVH